MHLHCREASDVIKKGKMCSLFINDLDAGAGRMGAGTQYTVNNQMVNATLMNIADNPTNVQLPGVYKNEDIPRVPVICTGGQLPVTTSLMQGLWRHVQMTAPALQLKVQGLLRRTAPHLRTKSMVCIPVLLAALCRVVEWLWRWDQLPCTALAYFRLLTCHCTRTPAIHSCVAGLHLRASAGLSPAKFVLGSTLFSCRDLCC